MFYFEHIINKISNARLFEDLVIFVSNSKQNHNTWIINDRIFNQSDNILLINNKTKVGQEILVIFKEIHPKRVPNLTTVLTFLGRKAYLPTSPHFYKKIEAMCA